MFRRKLNYSVYVKVIPGRIVPISTTSHYFTTDNLSIIYSSTSRSSQLVSSFKISKEVFIEIFGVRDWNLPEVAWNCREL
jgi:hypothetical protein